MRFAPRWPGGATNPVYADWRSRAPRVAAVMVLFVPRQDGLRVLLTERHAGLKHHGGELSLPGGSVEEGESLRQAALRETWEEVHLPANAIEVWGQLDGCYVPPSNFIVTPFTGLVLDATGLWPHDPEVTAIVEIPLARLLDATCTGETVDDRGRKIEYYEYEDRRVWGATARIINNLAEALGQPCEPWHLE